MQNPRRQQRQLVARIARAVDRTVGGAGNRSFNREEVDEQVAVAAFAAVVDKGDAVVEHAAAIDGDRRRHRRRHRARHRARRFGEPVDAKLHDRLTFARRVWLGRHRSRDAVVARRGRVEFGGHRRVRAQNNPRVARPGPAAFGQVGDRVGGSLGLKRRDRRRRLIDQRREQIEPFKGAGAVGGGGITSFAPPLAYSPTYSTFNVAI